MHFSTPLRIALLLLIAPAVLAGSRWTIYGPDGGTIRRLAFDPADSSIVHAASANGVFRSDDGGRHWHGALELLGTDFLDIAAAPGDPRIVFAASPYGLFKSTDRGLTWHMLQSSGFFHLAVSTQSADVVYAISLNGAVRSTDGGTTFGNRGSGLPPGLSSAIAVDPRTDSVVYAAFASAAGVYKSTDGGAHWVQANIGLTASQVFSLAVDPSDGATLYAGGGSTIFKSTDGAASWKVLATGFSDLTCAGLDVSPSSRTTVLAATNHGALISNDGGTSWHRGAGMLDANTSAVAIDSADAAAFLVAVSGHVDRTADGGATGVHSDSGLTAFAALGIAVDPHDDAVVYAGGPAGLARSADHGRTWSLSTAIQPSKIAVDANASTLYAISNTVQRSVDGGNTWSPFADALPQGAPPFFIVADPHLSGTLYVVANGAVYEKTGDAPWIHRDNGLSDSIDFVTIDTHDSSTVYAGGPDGMFKSFDGGANWTPVNAGFTGLNAVGLSVDPFDSRHLFGWSPTQAFESKDAAATWSLRTGVRGELQFDPSTPGVVYANAFDGVKRSTDGGQTWSSLSGGLPKTHSLLAIGVQGTPYLAASTGGVFVLTSETFARRRAAGR